MNWITHEVQNQVPALPDLSLFQCDPALQQAANAYQLDVDLLQEIGTQLGSQAARELAERANRHPPQFIPYDAQGRRVDRIELDPVWHALLQGLREHGMQARAWLQANASAHLQRAAVYYLHAQHESGSMCPVTMTFAALPLLQREPALYSALQDKLASNQHDGRDLPLEHKTAMLVGMGMTEKQGGSDLRSNSTIAKPAGSGRGRGEPHLLTGHKWFFSVPNADAHLVLAKSEGGLSCFFLPRWRFDGSRNAVQVQQLKDKLGNRSNPSGEVEFQEAWAVMVGEEGRGIPTLIEMAATTRMDCVIGSAGLMRAALLHALHHARHRHTFGRPLIAQPLMANLLADMALESEAAMHLMLRLARAFDHPEDEHEKWIKRVFTPAAKYWVCKRALAFTGESMEVWGGNGYVETGPMARFYREAPVNSIWEGSGNVMCLDVLRAISQEPQGLARLLAQFRAGAADHVGLQAALTRLQLALHQPEEAQGAARQITQDLVLLMQGQLMLEQAPEPIALAFIASRSSAAGKTFGDYGFDAATRAAILERACRF